MAYCLREMFDWLWKLIRKIFGTRPPKVILIKSLLEVDEMNVRVFWPWYTPSPLQDPSYGMRIEYRISEDLPWTQHTTVAYSDQDAEGEVEFFDVSPGPMFFRGTVVQSDGQEATPSETSVVIGFEGPESIQISAEVR